MELIWYKPAVAVAVVEHVVIIMEMVAQVVQVVVSQPQMVLGVRVLAVVVATVAVTPLQVRQAMVELLEPEARLEHQELPMQVAMEQGLYLLHVIRQ